MSASTTVRLVVDGEPFDLDLGQFMMTEAIALEDQWGLTTESLLSILAESDAKKEMPPLRIVLALVWIAKVRAIAAAAGVSFGTAAKQLPVDAFDVNLFAFEIGAPPEPPNPTPGVTPTPKTRTTRTTSAAKRSKRG